MRAIRPRALIALGLWGMVGGIDVTAAAARASATTDTTSTATATNRPEGSGPGSPFAAQARQVHPKVVAWRRDFHTNPELSNRETRTAAVVAAHLRRLGMEVRTGVAHTGVVGILRGGRPSDRVIALRADMDALPVEEKTGLPFASKAKGEYNGQTVPVMHACGHDAHTAMLMGAAEVLAGMRGQLAGTVVFLFQPAEEGPPKGEEGGAELMTAQGALANPKPQAVFGMHIRPGPIGQISYRPKGFFAASDRFEITLKGKQTHGSQPWAGIDILSLAADIIQATNQIAARQVDFQEVPHVITIATINGGVRNNIIPETLTMTGTLRTFDAENRAKLMAKMNTSYTHLASAYGASATLIFSEPNPVTYNDPALAARLNPALLRASANQLDPSPPLVTGSEDFGYFAKDIPGLYVVLGSTPPGTDWRTAPPNHSPYFDIDENALAVGTLTYVEVAYSFLNPSG